MEQFRKQTAIIAVLVVLIACSAWYAKKFNDQSKGVSNLSDKTTQTSKSNSNYFVEARSGRDNQLSIHKQELENIINNKNSTKEAIAQAQAKLILLADWADKQARVEQLAKQRGFEDAVCFINENGVELCVKSAEDLTSEQAAQLMDDVVRTTSISPTKIIIKNQK
ncbi:MAG: SpoIIIAH-like family protein [Caloramator sp.]|jgi:hypothetical protein|uniref:SpoIIIAH-like family protein n=1 Tax=Caloramator sp. TaxID=1871330 RepID=UPI001D2D1CEA|nr:SpoIIIAH-like family protein [Caloramator sp.]MBZ4662408.1 SpoIIIAH-like family protein [Caloramator sp.]